MRYQLILVFVLATLTSKIILAQDYGKGCIVNPSCYDSNYPNIEKWATAGVDGGIPTTTTIKATLNPGNDIQAAINSGGSGVVYLSNGTYTINSSLLMKDNVVLRGQSKAGVKLSVKMNNGEAVHFKNDVTHAGIENLRLVYEALPNDPVTYRTGFTDGGWCDECFQNDEPNYKASLIRIDGSNNWVDNVEVMKSGSDPVEIYGHHNTFRNSLVDNCYNKGGGGEGYFDLRGDYNLITGSTVRLIRHFSIQNGAGYNVVINNHLEVDINFHNGDEGYNLIEGNSIIRPSWHTWGVFATGGAAWGHKIPGPGTIIVNNTCYDYRENRNEFDSPNVIYTYTGYGEPDQTNWSMPTCGIFYAVNCGNIDSPPTISFTLPTNQHFVEGDDIEVAVNASDDGSVAHVKLYLDNVLVSQQSNAPYQWLNESVLQNMDIGNYTLKAIAEDDGGQTSEVTLNITIQDPNSPTQFGETFENMTLEGWGTETYIGDHGFTWTIDAKGTSGNIGNTKDIYFQAGITGVSSGLLSGGISSFSVKCKDLWEEGITRTIELLINGNVISTNTHTGTGAYTFDVININIDGDFTIAVRNASPTGSNKSIAIDEITWESYSVITNTKSKDYGIDHVSLYPNPTTSLVHLSNTFNWELFTFTGALLTKNESDEIDLSNFDQGIYLIKIKNTFYRTVKN